MTQNPRADWSAPLFVVSAGRSGSTLLTNILNAHPDVAMTHESYVFHACVISHLLASSPCGVVTETREIRLMGMVPPDYIESFAGLHKAAMLDLLKAFFLENFPDKQFVRWGDKFRRPECVAELIETFPRASFLHVVRDGRDRTVSARKFLGRERDRIGPEVQEGTFEDHCNYWVDLNQGTADALADHPSAMFVRYEDLIADPHAEAARVLAFLGLEHHPHIDHFLDGPSRTVQRGHGTSENASASRGRWREELTDEEKATADRIMGETLDHFGYTQSR